MDFLLPETFLQKLEVLQNQDFRFITGAVKITTIDSMLLLIGIKPLGIIFEKKAILLKKNKKINKN